MALGYCMDCDKLVNIRPCEQKWGSREVAWRPIHHAAPDGKPCNGHKREIVSTNPRAGIRDDA